MYAMNFAIQTIGVLYIWELIYRKEIGLPLLVHHIARILLIQLITASFFDTKEIVLMRFAVLMVYHATTEQASFIALLFFRLNLFERWQASWFFFACLLSVVIKSLVTASTIAVYSIEIRTRDSTMDTKWEAFWSICFIPLVLCLYGAQLYASSVLYHLGNRCKAPSHGPSTQNCQGGKAEHNDSKSFSPDDVDVEIDGQ
jgi:hypothetical protein